MTLIVRRRHRDGRRGQSLVEFALVLPVFFLVTFGLLDLGAFVFSDSVMSQAAREGARVGSTQAAWLGVTNAQEPGCANSAPVCPANQLALVANVTAAVRNASSGLTAGTTVYVRCDPANTPPPAGWTTGDCATNNTSGNLISVRVTYTFNPLTPVGRAAIGAPLRSGSATMVIN